MISATGQSMVMSSSSKFAGKVGMLDILNGLGLRLHVLLYLLLDSMHHFWYVIVILLLYSTAV